VVLLEDLGALLGLLVALFAVAMAVVTDNPRWDGVGSLTIGILLCCIAIVLAIEMKSLLIGESASAEHERQIRDAIGQSEGVRRLIHMRTEHIGPEELLVGAKVEFEEALTAVTLAEAVNAVEARVRELVPIARVIYIEPDVHRSPA
jgi:divalent metal cation (Fe/Co/Zn/Cd) transporter